MFRSGFFNAKNHDRQYYSSDVSKLFNSLINPGVFENVGNKFIVRPGTGMQVIVPSGMAWFNSTWTVNDSDEVIILDEAPYVANYNRIDAIFLRVYPENDTTVRDNTAYYVKGTETSGTPVKPVPTPTDDELYIPLCYITVNHGTTAITAAMIENCVGTEVCPFITGILETAHISDLLVQWQAQWNEWLTSEQNNFETWFESIRGQLDEDAAGHLQNEIDGINGDIDSINDRIDNLSTDAVDVNFDDTTAQLGASNVQTAIEKLKVAFSSALTSLKATPIAQAVGATGNTFAAVIQKLNAIVVRQNSPNTRWQNSSGRPVTNISNGGARGACSDGTVRTVVEIPTGYYQNGKDLIGITDLQLSQLGGFVRPSGNRAITANGSNIDVKSYATVSVSVPQTAFKRSYYLNTPSQGVLHLKVTRIYPWGSQVTFDGNVDVINNTYDDGYFRLSRLANNRWYYIFRIIRQVDGADSFLEIPEQILWYVSNVGYATTFTIPTRD